MASYTASVALLLDPLGVLQQGGTESDLGRKPQSTTTPRHLPRSAPLATGIAGGMLGCGSGNPDPEGIPPNHSYRAPVAGLGASGAARQDS